MVVGSIPRRRTKFFRIFTLTSVVFTLALYSDPIACGFGLFLLLDVAVIVSILAIMQTRGLRHAQKELMGRG